MPSPKPTIPLILIAVLTGFASAGEMGSAEREAIERAVLEVSAKMERAAEAMDADRLFEFVLENDKGSIIQGGRMLRTRSEALESTRTGLQGLEKVDYVFHQQHVTVVSPTVALVTAEGSSSLQTTDGRTVTLPFAQSVLFVLSDGQWKVLHAHRSFPANR
jgi:ketosteroid isomerase-like protein